MNINRLIYPGFWFGKTPKEEALELAKRGVGGFCIYGGTLPQVRELIAELRAVSPLPHLFMCADYEDGLGRWIEGESWVLSNMAVGAGQNPDIAYQKGLTLAYEARKAGIDWVFAPVLDLCDEPQNPIVNTRSFGEDAQQVAVLGKALCRGLKDGGVLNSIKHFPGHGRTTLDSHLTLPVLQRSLKDLQENELIPFASAFPVADSVMIGHLLLPQIDEKNPASLSPAVISLLKEKMGFNKLIFTDALCMKAIGDEREAALKALRAGAHILLSAENSLALSDFLQKQDGFQNIIAESAKLQEEAWHGLCAPAKQAFGASEFNRKYISECAVLSGEAPSFPPETKMAYLELGNEEKLVAQSFLSALEQQGFILKKPHEKADVLVAVSFSNFQAFKGHINLSQTEQETLCSLMIKYPRTVFVSFGSPFGTENIQGINTRIFLFSPADEAQAYAAEILAGKQKPKGKNPFGPVEKEKS